MSELAKRMIIERLDAARSSINGTLGERGLGEIGLRLARTNTLGCAELGCLESSIVIGNTAAPSEEDCFTRLPPPRIYGLSYLFHKPEVGCNNPVLARAAVRRDWRLPDESAITRIHTGFNQFTIADKPDGIETLCSTYHGVRRVDVFYPDNYDELDDNTRISARLSVERESESLGIGSEPTTLNFVMDLAPKLATQLSLVAPGLELEVRSEYRLDY